MSSHSQPVIRSICFYFDQNHDITVHVIKVAIIGMQMHFPRVYFKIKMSHISIKVITHAITSVIKNKIWKAAVVLLDEMLQKKQTKTVMFAVTLKVLPQCRG